MSLIQGIAPSGKIPAIAVTEDGLLRVTVSGSTAVPTSQQTTTALAPLLTTITLDTANVEKSVALNNVHFFEFYCRSNAAVRYAYGPGHAQGAVDPYRTLPAGASQPINFPVGMTWTGVLYLASDVAGVVIEVEAWQ